MEARRGGLTEGGFFAVAWAAGVCLFVDERAGIGLVLRNPPDSFTLFIIVEHGSDLL
jgi:hypothetical protein